MVKKRKITDLIPSPTPKNIVKKYSNLEAFNILKSLIKDRNVTKEVYTLIGLWLTGLLSSKQYAHLRTLTRSNINVFNFDDNTEAYKDLVQDLLLEFVSFKITETKSMGLRFKVAWDFLDVKDDKGNVIGQEPVKGNEGRVLKYIYIYFLNILYKCLGKSYRGGVSCSNVSSIKKREDIVSLRERMMNETDASITTYSLIKQLRKEGFTDDTIHQYRYAYSLGFLKNFTELTDEIVLKGSIHHEIARLTASENIQKSIYEYIFKALNNHSTKIPLVYREFLKAYYNLPSSVIDSNGKTKVFESNLVLFFEQFPEYKSVLKVKRLSYVGDKTYVRWTDKNNVIPYSEIFIEAHEALKQELMPHLLELKAKHEENIESANDIYLSLKIDNSQAFTEENCNIEDFSPIPEISQIGLYL